jgi:NAD(P)H dehydrogenase (quinone)
MTTLWIFAHPEGDSLNGALRDAGVARLRSQGHEVEESDLYAMGWKAVADGTDFPGRRAGEPLRYGAESERAYREGTLGADILAEQGKLARTELVIIQFPLWWYSVPAILKGWFDRVLTKGFAYGRPDPRGSDRTQRYGEGGLAGKRALLVVTAGGREPALGPRGVHGFVDHLLFPIQHGTLWYTGVSVLPPLLCYGANQVDRGGFAELRRRLYERLDTAGSTEPIPFRFQNDGDYDDNLVLADHLATTGTGPDIHLRREDPR